MTLNEELSAIEAAVDECEKEIASGTISVTTIVSQICPSADFSTQMLELQEQIASMNSRIEHLPIQRLRELKFENPNNSRISKVAHRAAECFVKLMKIGFEASEHLATPDVKMSMQSNHQEAMVTVKNVVSDLLL
jgi:TolA-binding protein